MNATQGSEPVLWTSLWETTCLGSWMCRLLNCVGAQPWGIKTVQPANTIDLTGASHDSGCSQSHPPSMMAHIVSVLLLWIFAPILWICLCPSCKELFFPNLLQILAMYWQCTAAVMSALCSFGLQTTMHKGFIVFWWESFPWSVVFTLFAGCASRLFFSKFHRCKLFTAVVVRMCFISFNISQQLCVFQVLLAKAISWRKRIYHHNTIKFWVKTEPMSKFEVKTVKTEPF